MGTGTHQWNYARSECHPAAPENKSRRILAAFERLRSGLDSRPVANLRKWLNDQGVRVFWLEIPGNEFTGLSWWHKVYGPCMLANLKDSPERRNFTMAHELAHLLIDAPAALTVCDLTDIAGEKLANRFAAEFLMPEADVRSYWLRVVEGGAPIDHMTLVKIARRYGSKHGSPCSSPAGYSLYFRTPYSSLTRRRSRGLSAEVERDGGESGANGSLTLLSKLEIPIGCQSASLQKCWEPTSARRSAWPQRTP